MQARAQVRAGLQLSAPSKHWPNQKQRCRTGEYNGHSGNITSLLVLGDHLLSLGEDARLLVWKIGDYAAPEVWAFAAVTVAQLYESPSWDYVQVTVELDPALKPTCLAHPDTYLNKARITFVLAMQQRELDAGRRAAAAVTVAADCDLRRDRHPYAGHSNCSVLSHPAQVVVGGANGQVQLWNFVSGLLLHTFQVSSSAVRCIQPGPALDVVGVGLADGCVLLAAKCLVCYAAVNYHPGQGKCIASPLPEAPYAVSTGPGAGPR